MIVSRVMTSHADRIIELYERHAEDWRRRSHERRFLERETLDRFLTLAPKNGSVLDLGCGSGEPVADYLVTRGHHVTGVDSSPTLLGFCRARHPGAQWIEADMRTLALGRRFDAILAWNSFFHLDHHAQRGMFPIFAAHASADAPLMFTSGPAHGEAIGTYQGEPLYHASLDEAEYRTLLDRNGFDVVSYRPEDETCGKHTIWLARRR